MITNYFITRRNHNLEEPVEKKVVIDSLGRSFPVEGDISDNQIIVTDSLDLFHETMKNGDIFGLDTENNSLNQYYADQLLTQIAIPGISFVIDEGSIDEDYLQNYQDKIYIGHNLQYDYRILKYKRGWELRRLIDIMINEQIINRGSGRLNNLQDSYFRRIGKTLPEDKSTRRDFIRMTPKSLMKRKHIIYSGFDPQTGLQILPIQQEILGRYNLDFRANAIAMPLIPILGDMNLEGRTLNKELWRKNLEENKLEKFRLEKELDAIVKEFAKDNVKLRGGIWSSASRTRKKEEGEQGNLFGEGTSISTEATKNISYNSSQQLTKLFKILKEPLPEKEDTKAEKDWANGPVMKVSFDEPTLEQYKITNPGSKMIPFINKLLEFKEVEKEISSFGEIYLKEYVKDGKSGKKHKRGYYQPKTDRVHTIYKQEFTANGRLASGGEKKGKGELGVGFDNSQNWPKKSKFRNAIVLTQQEIDDGWYMSTSDLTSAELVILASKSQDPNLMKYCRADLHSYLATHSYTRVIQYILNTMSENRAYDELYQLLKVNRIQREYKIATDDLDISGEVIKRDPTPKEIEFITNQRVEMVFAKKAITIDKKSYPDIREPYKNCTYGYTYGAGDDKRAKTLNIAIYYAKLVGEGIGIAIPKADAFLNKIAQFGVRNGYIEFNERTHSRHWFKSWLEAREYGRQLTGGQRSAIERACKNYVMSGTQADILKEAMVKVNEFVRKEKIPFKWLMQVHDEIVFKHKDKDLRPVIEKIVTDTANLYLTNIEMEMVGYTGYYWNK